MEYFDDENEVWEKNSKEIEEGVRFVGDRIDLKGV